METYFTEIEEEEINHGTWKQLQNQAFSGFKIFQIIFNPRFTMPKFLQDYLMFFSFIFVQRLVFKVTFILSSVKSTNE